MSIDPNAPEALANQVGLAGGLLAPLTGAELTQPDPSAFEFSQAKLQFESAESAWLRAKYDFIFKIKILELYFGIPITDL